MREEELLRQARLYGERVPEELTFGELAQVLELGAERERRFLQELMEAKAEKCRQALERRAVRREREEEDNGQ